MKDFYDWNKKKIKIDGYKEFQHPKEGEIWWCRLGVNIGCEVYGKGKEYTRPVLIINEEGSENCICIPISSKIKNTKYSCIIKTDDDKLHTALVYQIRSIDKRRLKEKIYDLNQGEYEKIKAVFDKLFKSRATI
jgi:mRNA interferase MazF